ncbi:hypothetical protein DPMN_163855 [Dreissena polymorpha]|uniref:DDE Tnp4 domain-containing protein n=1 Tax=Dreissena polymorpha TaxID=45954 RepID=A0A9D4EXK0_DREPO|nr:hypothetical protein DPMN_163855 [Dreissena polymorpha]
MPLITASVLRYITGASMCLFQLTHELEIHAQMPSFMPRGSKQLPADLANSSRLVTKVRLVVEAANARIKRCKYLDHILPTNQVPYIDDYIESVCSLCNKFISPLSANCESSEDVLCA